MLQRIQSIYYLLASVCLLGSVFFDAIQLKTNTQTLTFGVWEATFYQSSPQIQNISSKPTPILVLTFFVALMAFAAIFQYRNRFLQQKFGRLVIILSMGLVFMCVGFVYNLSKDLMPSAAMPSIVPGVAAFLPFLAIVFAFLANKNVKKDDDLVKSADRIR